MAIKKICVSWAAVFLLAACSAPVSRDPARVPAAPGVTLPVGQGVFRIDTTRSELRLFVRRAGPMARFGHNHVIVNRALAGWVRFTGQTTSASLTLRVPVEDFVVDDADLRRQAGADFAEDVGDDAKAGTRRNMLGTALLDAEHYPVITLTSVGISGEGGSLQATMSVTVAGHESVLVVPFGFARSNDSLTINGTAVMRQSALGLVPFSIMLGALQVQDEFTAEFKLVAVGS